MCVWGVCLGVCLSVCLSVWVQHAKVKRLSIIKRHGKLICINDFKVKKFVIVSDGFSRVMMLIRSFWRELHLHGLNFIISSGAADVKWGFNKLAHHCLLNPYSCTH